MIWVIAAIEAVLIALCIYQIREVLSKMHQMADMINRLVGVSERINQTVRDVSETTGYLTGRVSNNEHRIRDIYKAINDLKGWPTNEVK